MSKSEFVNLELDVLDWDRGQLTVPGRKVLGHPQLSTDLLTQGQDQKLDLKAYGSLLFDALLPKGDPMRDSYRTAIDDARKSEKLIRFKLTLSLAEAEQLHRLRWECLYDREKQSAIARDPETAFSRYAPIGKDDAAPVLERPRLLLAIADPTNCKQHEMDKLNRDEMQRQLESALRPLKGQMDWEFMTPPVTPNQLRSYLSGGEYNALHLVAHGYVDPKRQISFLVMEEPSGECDFVDEEHLSEIFLGDRRLRLVTLISCHGGVQSLATPLSGLGRRLVDRGLPAVISMQDTVSFATAEEFPKYFYATLARCRSVDAALNETRHQLFLTDARSSRWSDPVLFMRLRDGLAWNAYPDLPPLESEIDDILEDEKPHPGNRSEEADSAPGSIKNLFHGGLHQEQGFVGDNLGTVNITKSVAEQSPEEKARHHYDSGLGLFREGAYDAAARKFSRALEYSNSDKEVNYYLALAILANRRPRALSLTDARRIESHLLRAIQGQCGSHAHLLLAYVKHDYFVAKGQPVKGLSIPHLLNAAADQPPDPVRLDELRQNAPVDSFLRGNHVSL